MPIGRKTIKKNHGGSVIVTDVIVTDNVKSYANDPFFVEKLEKAKKALSNATFPDHLKK